MIVTTKITWDVDGNILEHEFYEYNGPVAKLDRAAAAEAKNAAATAANTAAQEQSQANAASARLTPFFSQEMQAQHMFNPGQQNELLNYNEQGAGGANAGLAGTAASEAARTRNTSGFSSALDAAARSRQSAMGSAGLGIGEADIMGAKQLNQAGAQGMAGLYGTDTEAMLKSMGIQTGDINAQIEAGKSGFFQNLMQGIQAGTGVVTGLFGAGGVYGHGSGGGAGGG